MRKRSGNSKWLAFAILAATVVGAGDALAAKDLFVVDLASEPATLDPQLQWSPDTYFVYRNVFDNLLTRDDDGKIAPQVASSWKQIDASTIEFQLQPGIKFHDGTALTADDVVYTVKRITDPAFKSPQLDQFNKIVGAEAVDAKTVRLKTDGPYPVLLAQLTKLSIIPKAYVEKVGGEQFNVNPMGSGPYKFASLQRGVRVALARNDAYWGAKGPFAQVEFHPVPEVATRIADLRSGKADFIVTINSDLAKELKSDPKVKVLSVLSERVAYFQLNSLVGPTADLRIRQAIAHAIDREGIINGIMGGFDKPVTVMLSPVHVGYVDGFKGYAYDKAKAQALIKEAGEPAKAPLTLFTAPIFDQRIVQAIQQMLTEVGLKVNIETSDFTAWLKRAQSGPAEFGAMTFSRWSCGCQDADGVLFPLLYSKSQWSKSSNPEIDKELEAARSTVDESARLPHYKRVYQLAEETVPLVPLYQAAILYAARKELRWRPTPNESLFLNRMGWDE
ncbi:MAG: peptide ABC transporter [Proteobacteria bacterium]|nr:peptide ABC transporter [Pseudomonadota bacterium]MBI3497310.1 peptide ABC transporter [Pseudomonadota bacterium]